MVKVTGTIINYFFHCKKQCWLFMKKINLEDNSEEVEIGRVLHEEKSSEKNSELAIENIKIDKITQKYIIEMKKSDADIEAAKKQLKYYMYLLNQKGIKRDGKIEVFEKSKRQTKTEIVLYTDQLQEEMVELEAEIQALYDQPYPPDIKMQNKCKKCAYYEYCYI